MTGGPDVARALASLDATLVQVIPQAESWIVLWTRRAGPARVYGTHRVYHHRPTEIHHGNYDIPASDVLRNLRSRATDGLLVAQANTVRRALRRFT